MSGRRIEHRGTSETLDQIYRRVGELVFLHNLLERQTRQVLVDLFPADMRAAQLADASRQTFAQKRESLKLRAQGHALLSQALRGELLNVCSRLRALNADRNRIVHAVERWRADDEDAAGGDPDRDIDYLVRFEDAARGVDIDTSFESLDQLIAGFIELVSDLDHMDREVRRELSDKPRYGYTDDPDT